MSAISPMLGQGLDRPNWPLGELLAGFAAQPFESGTRVTGLALDSRAVTAGSLFLACRGRGTHGLHFLEMAAERGCVAVAAEPDRDWGVAEFSRLAGEFALPVIPVANLAKRAAEIAARFFGHPSDALEVFGVTGTFGKTRVVQYLAEALAADGPTPGLDCAVLGTPDDRHVAAQAADADALGPRTLDAVAVQRELARLVSVGARAVAMEVSSQALAQGRVGSVCFSHAVLTNLGRDDLGRDHLDHPADVAADAAAACRLLRAPGLRWAVLNDDDPLSAELAAVLPAWVQSARYGSGAHPPAGDADLWVWARRVSTDAAGLRVDVETSVGAGQWRARLIGRSRVANLLAVLALLLTRGEPLPSALTRLGAVRGPAGRMEPFGGDGRPLVVVDDARTPAALAQALAEVRGHCRGRLWVVFGCGGGRDAGTRAAMGATAERLADGVIVTDDNPRMEDAAHIVHQILAGMTEPRVATVERQRGLAIRLALARAGRDDAVLVAGKGAETAQQMGELRVQFSDRAQVVQALGEWEGCRK
jgi:UDP-N-acetylmuramoyl-L-alanyl-D-glutamate--2,6-diaminopimelate ligase